MQPPPRALAAPPKAAAMPVLASGAVAGVAAAALALAVGHLVATVTGAATSPLIAVGSAVIDAAPQAAKAFAIETFGANDKPVLLGGIGVVLLLLAAVVGAVAVRSTVAGVLAIGTFGLAGAIAALARPLSTPGDALPALLGAVAAMAALAYLVRLVRQNGAAPSPGPSADQGHVGRRSFVLATAIVGGLALAIGALGFLLQARRDPTGAGVGSVPSPDDPARTTDPAVDLGVVGITPFITPNADFYRVDTALVPPVVRVEDWRLRVHGLVARELTLSYDELVQLPLVERDITLACVSNQVGGPYVGNARWIGVPLATVLEEAGVMADADQLVSRSIDGMTIGTPVAVALDGRDSLLAVAMNGEPLPVEHGFPVRMVIPGLYGYVSATKWLTELELTRFDAYDPYWVQRGWAREAPVKTMSRIDTPRPLATVPAGRVAIGGVAWAQHRGIDRVEVRIDDRAWTEARLGAVDTVDTWRQWTLDWAATPGRHSISVRATDGSDALQPEDRAEPFPSGASGWHTVVMTVS